MGLNTLYSSGLSSCTLWCDSGLYDTHRTCCNMAYCRKCHTVFYPNYGKKRSVRHIQASTHSCTLTRTHTHTHTHAHTYTHKNTIVNEYSQVRTCTFTCTRTKHTDTRMRTQTPKHTSRLMVFNNYSASLSTLLHLSLSICL